MGCQGSKSVECGVKKNVSEWSVASEPGFQARSRAQAPTPTLLTAGAINHPGPKLEVKAGNVREQARVIKVYFANGEHVELPLQFGDTLCDLSRRIADIKDAGWATLLLGTKPLDEKAAAASIPDGQAVTAMLQDGWERPDRLNKTVREQIRRSFDIHGVSDFMRSENVSIEDAFKAPNWSNFREICQPIQDIRITVFEFACQRYVEYNFGWRENGFGSAHAMDSVDAIMSYDDGHWEPLMEPLCDFCDTCFAGVRGCLCKEERHDGVWGCTPRVQPPPPDADYEDDDEDDNKEDNDYDADGESLGHLQPFFRALVEASKSNQLAKYGVEW